MHPVSTSQIADILHFSDNVWYLEKERKSAIEAWSIDRVLNKKHSYQKIMQKMSTKN